MERSRDAANVAMELKALSTKRLAAAGPLQPGLCSAKYEQLSSNQHCMVLMMTRMIFAAIAALASVCGRHRQHRLMRPRGAQL